MVPHLLHGTFSQHTFVDFAFAFLTPAQNGQPQWIDWVSFRWEWQKDHSGSMAMQQWVSGSDQCNVVLRALKFELLVKMNGFDGDHRLTRQIIGTDASLKDREVCEVANWMGGGFKGH